MTSNRGLLAGQAASVTYDLNGTVYRGKTIILGCADKKYKNFMDSNVLRFSSMTFWTDVILSPIIWAGD